MPLVLTFLTIPGVIPSMTVEVLPAMLLTWAWEVPPVTESLEVFDDDGESFAWSFVVHS